jgi:thiol-disulfide isomerase/thioredoxin
MLACASLSLIEVARPLGPLSHGRPTPQFAVGAPFPVLTGRDEDGPTRLRVPYGGDLAFVFVLSPFCSPCEQVAPHFRRLIEEVCPPESRPLPVDVLLISVAPLDLAQEFVEQIGLSGRVFAVNTSYPNSDEELQTALAFSTTPQAFLIAGDGSILRQAAGLSADEAEEWVACLWDQLAPK